MVSNVDATCRIKHKSGHGANGLVTLLLEEPGDDTGLNALILRTWYEPTPSAAPIGGSPDSNSDEPIKVSPL